MKRLLLLLLFATVVFAQGGGQPVNVPVQNPSFESSVPLILHDPCGVRGPGSDAAGWKFGYDSWLFQPANPNTCGIPAPPNGQTVALISSYGISQILGTTPEQLQATANGNIDGLYTLTFWVTNYYPGYPSYQGYKISYGTQELCDGDIWITHVWTKAVVPCPSPIHLLYESEPGGGPGQGKQPLTISFSKSAGWIPLVAGPVSLTFTPTN